MPGVERILVPGEQSREKFRERSKHGVPLPEALHASLAKLASELNIAPL
jgi:LDH2 family malate/lactate/ureidoglycolate dehydrogenase